MPAYKNKDAGTWYVVTQYTDWTGERKQKCKRGFSTRREALEWEQKFQQQSSGDLDINFEAFIEIYTADLKVRLKESTWQTKENIIKTKILPYFGKRKINEITTKDVIAWQNELLAYRDEQRQPYSPSYLKTLHNQLSAIFNHAVRFYDLRSNPAAKAGNMGNEERKEMLFWTKEEYLKFAEEMMDKPVSYYAFQMLYWTGIREGELLALTPADFDFEKGTVRINKTYQRLKGQDVITSPKTKKSNRTIQMPAFLCVEMQEFFGMQYGLRTSTIRISAVKKLIVWIVFSVGFFFLLWKKRLIPRSMELVGTFRNSARITPTSIGTRKPAADFTTPITEPRFIRRTNMVTPAIVTINGCFNFFSIRFYFLLL